MEIFKRFLLVLCSFLPNFEARKTQKEDCCGINTKSAC